MIESSSTKILLEIQIDFAVTFDEPISLTYNKVGKKFSIPTANHSFLASRKI